VGVNQENEFKFPHGRASVPRDSITRKFETAQTRLRNLFSGESPLFSVPSAGKRTRKSEWQPASFDQKSS